MMVKNAIRLMVLSLLLLSSVATALPAYAQSTEPQRKAPGPLNSCTQSGGAQDANGNDCNCRSRYKGDLLAVIIPCIRNQVIEGTIRMTNEFDSFLEGTTYAFLTLVIALFGVKVLMAEGDPKKDGFILLIKIGAVLAFTNNFGGMITAPFAIMQEGVEIVSDAIPISSQVCGEYVNEVNSVGGFSALPAEAPWVYYDCVLGKLMGFAPETFVGASALGVAGTALWSGQFGTVFFLGAVSAFFFILKLIIRAVYTYLMAVMALAFLIFISPLLIPLIWLPSTQQYFDRWLGGFMAMLVFPTIITAYLVLSFSLLDRVVFDDTIGIANMLSKEKTQELWRGRETHNSERQQHAVSRRAGVNDSNLASTANVDPSDPKRSGLGEGNIFSRAYTIDFRSDEAGTASNMFFGFISLVIMAYLLVAMLDQLIQLTQVMLGGGFFMQAAVTDNPFERGLTATQQSVQSTASNTFNASNPAAGAQALASGLAQAPNNIVQAMVGNRR